MTQKHPRRVAHDKFLGPLIQSKTFEQIPFRRRQVEELVDFRIVTEANEGNEEEEKGVRDGLRQPVGDSSGRRVDAFTFVSFCEKSPRGVRILPVFLPVVAFRTIYLSNHTRSRRNQYIGSSSGPRSQGCRSAKRFSWPSTISEPSLTMIWSACR